MSQYFSTGPEPNHLVDSNVKWTYPIHTQSNLYVRQTPNGSIQLKQGRDNLFNPNGYNYVMKFRSNDNKHLTESKAVYKSGERKVSFGIPQDLKAETIYHLILTKEPSVKNTQISNNVEIGSVNLQTNTSETTAAQKTKKLSSTIQEGDASQILYKKFFRTAKYGTFEEKIDYINQTIPQGLSKRTPRVKYLETSFDAAIHILEIRSNRMDELFDELELKGSGNMKPLVSFTAGKSNLWYSRKLAPITYSIYPIRTSGGSFEPLKRRTNIPPVNNSVYWRQIDIGDNGYTNPLLTAENLTTNRYRGRTGMFGLLWDFTYHANKDYRALRAACSNLKSSGHTFMNQANVNRLLLSEDFPPAEAGRYKIVVKYFLPDGNRIGISTIRADISTH